jgi:membrane fusion protein (multidrug efflux system)
VQVDPIWVNFGIPDHEQARVQEQAASGRLVLPKNGGFQVVLRRADGSLYGHTGRVNFADVRVNPATGTREMRAEVANPDLVLRPGEFVRVILKGATRPQALTVPQKAVLEGPQGKFVYVVNEKSAAEPRPVELGEWAGQDWVVLNGLKPGDKVIVDGLMKLGPGAPVKIAEPGQKPPAGEQKPPAKKP